MNKRAQQKEASLARILEVTSARLRQQGEPGVAISSIMQEAGLTHGAFYAHFDNKDELSQQAFRYAINKNQPSWFDESNHTNESWRERLVRLSRKYLTPAHRDDVANSCAISALASDVDKMSDEFRKTYSDAVSRTLAQISKDDPEHLDDAIIFLSTCVGALLLSRNVAGYPELSDRILTATRKHLAALADF